MNNETTSFTDRTGTEILIGDSVQLRTAQTYEQPEIFVISQHEGRPVIGLPGANAATSPAVKLTQQIAEQLVIVARAGSET